MRISENEKAAIVYEAINQFGVGTQVILFGSRAKDEARGGDIDLLIIPSCDWEDTYTRKINFLVCLKNVIDDQKIDVLIKHPVDSRGIVKTALQEGIALC
jgi:predicted nucleotidyltransferase